MLKKYSVIFFLIAMSLSSGGYLSAAPVQWSGNNHWYEAVYVENGITWWDAKKEAEKRGGYLATSTSSDENEFIYSLIDFFNNEYNKFWNWDGAIGLGPWLGGYQINNENEPGGNWAWVSGETWSYTNWESAEPNNYGGSEDYLHFIYNTYHWPPDPKNGTT